ncbi:MAG: sigma-70 family RNA polymerase sigma factor [Candidatus Eisenbacteria bacterium]|uniref:Sigma-70 family RNA polymerase sigma factor n=1 Tax=Eiseniibacteriota bacterium TaxID=2212470 RepID=A0A956M144_UNCEI|nr:sigma-70 family RNA polymerase sigma factor [Candidatus Eisenbacteria bacterium]
MQNASSESLLAACLTGDERAWDEMIRRFANLIYSTILRTDLPTEEVEEAFQASIVAIHQQLGTLRDPARIVPWIIGISYRQAINRIRARRRESVGAVSHAMLEASGLVPEVGDLPDQQRVRLELAHRVQRAMESLPERCRSLLHSLFFEDPSPEYAEIADRYGIPIGSIGPTRARCLDKMRQAIERSDAS